MKFAPEPMPHRRRLEPYLQGDLDGLCGIYAIVNAIRLALVNQNGRFTDEDWHELFCARSSPGLMRPWGLLLPLVWASTPARSPSC